MPEGSLEWYKYILNQMGIFINIWNQFKSYSSSVCLLSNSKVHYPIGLLRGRGQKGNCKVIWLRNEEKLPKDNRSLALSSISNYPLSPRFRICLILFCTLREWSSALQKMLTRTPCQAQMTLLGLVPVAMRTLRCHCHWAMEQQQRRPRARAKARGRS